jgi:hypothetical protein
MFEQVLEKRKRVLPLDDLQTLEATLGVATVLTKLDRENEALWMYEVVVPNLIRVNGEDNDITLMAMDSMSTVQYILSRFDDSKQTATSGLLIARRVGNDIQAARFVNILSGLEKIEEAKIFAATASDEQKELRQKIELRKQAKAKATADEAALLATRAEATTEDDLDALMAEFGFEEGDDCSGGKGEKKKSGGGSKKKKKKGK